MTEDETMAAVGQAEPSMSAGLQLLAEYVEQLRDLTRMMVDEAQVGVLELRAGEVEAWTRTVQALILEIMPAIIRWSVAGVPHRGPGPRGCEELKEK